ncbi:hypothetical protein C1H46_021656 [Malus baccata]|uniref:Uncharacterized protein n=1 Tax=Malus baccata TaxID=106549 RepID=A0A540M1X2_MALBA|nr:hypothetical protein C1H46_021656 [Malus baccata]
MDGRYLSVSGSDKLSYPDEEDHKDSPALPPLPSHPRRRKDFNILYKQARMVFKLMGPERYINNYIP